MLGLETGHTEPLVHQRKITTGIKKQNKQTEDSCSGQGKGGTVLQGHDDSHQAPPREARRQFNGTCKHLVRRELVSKCFMHFLGMVGYYQIISCGATTGLLKKEAKFVWSDRCQSAFDNDKGLFCSVYCVGCSPTK